MVISQGEIWWADLREPVGSAPGYRRPVIVVQCDSMNHSRIGTTVCVPLTTNLKWASANGNVLFRAADSGLERDSVANVSQILAPDKKQLIDYVGFVDQRLLDRVLAGIDVVLGR